jgi:hypothetical protein
VSGHAETGNARNGGRDNFFTSTELAAEIVERTVEALDRLPDLWVEPSAGGGAFLNPLAATGVPVAAFDLLPAHPAVRSADWFDVPTFSVPHVVIGNPPFGKSGKLARQFMAKAAADPSCVGVSFLLPSSFERSTVQAFVTPALVLASSVRLPLATFVSDGRTIVWDSVWQLWTPNRSESRTSSVTGVSNGVNHPELRFQRAGSPVATVTVRRAGWNAGTIGFDPNVSLHTHHFLTPTENGLEALKSGETVLREYAARETRATRSLPRVTVIKVLESAGLI